MSRSDTIMLRATTVVMMVTVASTADLYGGAWTLPRHGLWTKVAFFTLRADEQFAENGGILPDAGVFAPGNRIPFFNDGESSSRAAFLDVHYGLTDRVDLGMQIPYYTQSFEDNVTRSRRQDTGRSGFSDITGMVKVRLLQAPVVTSVVGHVKFPTGDFENIDGVVPVGEGQTDLSAMVSLGYSLWPRPGYVNLEVGWRFRRENAEAQFDPGDELVFLWEGGYDVHPRIQVGAKVSGLFGRPSRFGLRFVTNRPKREILYVSPELTTRSWKSMRLGAGVNIPIQGRTYPAGRQYFVSLASHL